MSGRYPEPGSTDEILVGEGGALREGITVGDRLPVTALPCFECEAGASARPPSSASSG